VFNTSSKECVKLQYPGASERISTNLAARCLEPKTLYNVCLKNKQHMLMQSRIPLTTTDLSASVYDGVQLTSESFKLSQSEA
jgi:hypothetical protein